jgi:hypothetical protein
LSFEPENDLERTLVAASQDAAEAPAFYRALLDATLWFVQEPAAAGGRADAPDDGFATVRIRSVVVQGEEHLPVYSAASRVPPAARADGSCKGLPARDFFQAAAGMPVYLQTSGGPGKQLLVPEIAALLDGSIFAPRSMQPHVVTEERQVLLAQPAVYPTHLTDALGALFAKRRDVRAAYLAHYHDAARSEKPLTLIGLDAAGDWDALMGEIAQVLDRVTRPGELVDFVKIERGAASGVTGYLVGTKPFYRRKRFGLF